MSNGFYIGIRPQCNLRVSGTHIGGHLNCRFVCDASGRWRIQHMGHARSIHVAGERIDNVHERVLVPGDIIQLDTNPGHELRFVFEVE